MRGADTFTESLFTMRKLEDFNPAEHPLRAIRMMANKQLAKMGDLLSVMNPPDAKGGRQRQSADFLVVQGQQAPPLTQAGVRESRHLAGLCGATDHRRRRGLTLPATIAPNAQLDRMVQALLLARSRKVRLASAGVALLQFCQWSADRLQLAVPIALDLASGRRVPHVLTTQSCELETHHVDGP